MSLHRILPLTPQEKARITRGLNRLTDLWLDPYEQWTRGSLSTGLAEDWCDAPLAAKLPAVHAYAKAQLPRAVQAALQRHARHCEKLQQKIAKTIAQAAKPRDFRFAEGLRMELSAQQAGAERRRGTPPELVNIDAFIRLAQAHAVREGRATRYEGWRAEAEAHWRDLDAFGGDRQALSRAEKLRRITVQRGATPGEAANAQAILARLLARSQRRTPP